MPDSNWLMPYNRVSLGDAPARVAQRVSGLSPIVVGRDGLPFDHMDGNAKLFGQSAAIHFEFQRDGLFAVSSRVDELTPAAGDRFMADLSAYYDARLGPGRPEDSGDPPWRVKVVRWSAPGGLIELNYTLAEPLRFLDWEYRRREAWEEVVKP